MPTGARILDACRRLLEGPDQSTGSVDYEYGLPTMRPAQPWVPMRLIAALKFFPGHRVPNSAPAGSDHEGCSTSSLLGPGQPFPFARCSNPVVYLLYSQPSDAPGGSSDRTAAAET